MQKIGDKIRELREEAKMPLRKLAAMLDLDQSTLSKIERGERQANKEQIAKIATIFNIDKKTLLIDYLSDKILYELKDEEFGEQVLMVAEEKIKYLKKSDL